MNLLELANAYLTDRHSPFNSTAKPLRYVTKEGYKRLIARLVSEIGDRDLGAMGSRDFLELHAAWVVGERVAMAHSLATMLRTLIGFEGRREDDRKKAENWARIQAEDAKIHSQ